MVHDLFQMEYVSFFIDNDFQENARSKIDLPSKIDVLLKKNQLKLCSAKVDGHKRFSSSGVKWTVDSKMKMGGPLA